MDVKSHLVKTSSKENISTRELMNAKIELLLVIENLTQIGHTYLRTFGIMEGIDLGDKMERLTEAIHRGNSLIKLLNEVFKCSTTDNPRADAIKIKPMVDPDDDFSDLSMKQNSPPSSPQSISEVTACADEIKDNVLNEKKLICEKCDVMFKTLANLKYHMKTVHKNVRKFYSCELCEKSFLHKNSLREHTHLHADKRFQCEICQKIFTTARYFKLHERIHKNPTFHCELCPRSFVVAGDLEKHKRNHTGEKPFICDQCPKAFAQRMNLINHRKFHGKANFHCDANNCTKSFIMKADLERHKRIHTGVKPYCCELCGKSYADLASLKYHKERIHITYPLGSKLIASKKRFFCDKCEKSFPRPQNLKIHQRKHTGERPFQCEQCPKSFPLKQGLQKHILNIHTGEKPFLCHQCDHACKTKWLLQQHIDARHDDTRYNCQVCDFTTTQRRLIQRHNKIYHKNIQELSKPYSESSGLMNKHNKEEIYDDAQKTVVANFETTNLVTNLEVQKNEYLTVDVYQSNSNKYEVVIAGAKVLSSSVCANSQVHSLEND